MAQVFGSGELRVRNESLFPSLFLGSEKKRGKD